MSDPIKEMLSGKGKGGRGGSSSDPIKAMLSGKSGSSKDDKGLLDKAKSAGGNLVGGALNALDFSGAVIRAGAIELGDGVRALAGKDPIGDHGNIRDTGFSLSDFRENVKRRVGVGDILETPGSPTEDLPLNVKRALGFVGDVALDPTTYLTAGATTAGKGAAKGGQMLGKDDIVRGLLNLGDDEVAALGGREVVDELANQAARGAISREAAEAVGARTGLQFQLGLPGVGGRTFTAPGTSGLAETLGRAGAATREGIKGRFSQGFVEKLQVVPTEGIRRADRGGMGALNEFAFREANRKTATAAAMAASHLDERLKQIVKGAADTDRDALRKAIEAGDYSNPVAKQMADLFEEGAQLYEQATGKSLKRRDGYLTHMLTPEGRKVVKESTERFRKGGKEVFEHARELDGTIDEINQAALEKFGKDAVKLFEENPFGIAEAWIGMIERSIRKGGLERALAEQGLVEVVNKKAIGRALKRNERTAKRIADKAAKGAERGTAASVLRSNADEMRRSFGLEGVDDVLAPDGRLADQADLMDRMGDRAAARADAAEAGRGGAFDDAQQARFRQDAEGPTPAEAKAVEKAEAALSKAQVKVDDLRVKADQAAAELAAARKAVEVEKKRVYGRNRTAKNRAARSSQGLKDAKARLEKARAADAGAKKKLADARRELTNAQKALDDATKVQVSGEAAPAGAGEPAEVAALRSEKAALPDQIKQAKDELKAAKAEYKKAEKGLDFGAADGEKIKAASRSDVEAAIARVDEAQRALDAANLRVEELLERAKYIDEDIEYALGKAGTAAAPAPGAVARTVEESVDLTDLAKAVEAAGIKVDKAAAKKALTERSAKEAEDALAAVEDAAGVTAVERMDPKFRARRNALKRKAAKQAEALAKAEADLADKAFAFDTARRAMDDNVAKRAADNAEALQRAKAEIDSMSGEVERWREVEVTAREKAAQLWEAANVDPSPERRLIARVEAAAAEAEGHQARLMREANDLNAKFIPVDDASLNRYLRVAQEHMRQFAGHKNMYAHPEVAEAVELLRDNLTPQRVKGILKAHDQVLARWKAWSLLSPGYHGRNLMSAMFMNGVAGMDGSGARAYIKFGRSWKRLQDDGLDEGLKWVRSKYGNAYADQMATTHQWGRRIFGEAGSGIDAQDALKSGGQTQRGVLGDAARTGKRNYDPTALDFAPLAFNFKTASKVERLARGPLFMDGLAKGLDPQAAYDRVIKFHFDYSELSQLEQSVARRVIPFYTWMRKNFPLQIEMMARKPGHYTRYLHAKRNIEHGTDEDSLVPAYFKDLLAIRTPFKSSNAKNIDGGQANIYLTPDLPFVNLAETFDTNILLSQMSPFIKTPLEAMSGKQFFSGIPFNDKLKPAPKSPLWEPILATLSVADGKFGLPKVEKHANGDWMITDKDAYKIEQFLPILGRMRRVAPSEERFQERQLTTWMSVFLGVGARTNGEREQQGEQRRIEYELADLRKRAKELTEDPE